MSPSPSDPIVPTPPATELSDSQSAALMTNSDFRGRVKVCLVRYANSILDEAVSAPFHNTKLRFAQAVMQNPDQQAQQYQPPVVMDGAVQAAGSAITDNALQGSVEATVNKLM